MAKEIFLKHSQIMGVSGWMFHSTRPYPPTTSPTPKPELWNHYGRRGRHAGAKELAQNFSGKTLGRASCSACGGNMSQRQTGIESFTRGQVWLLLFPLPYSLPWAIGAFLAQLWDRKVWGNVGLSLQLKPRTSNERLYSLNLHVEALTSRTLDCDCIWR